MQRPTGVTLLGWLSLVQGLVGLFWPLLAFGVAGIAGAYFGGAVGATLGVLGILIGIFKLFGPIFHLVLSYGFFQMKSWAWMLGLILPSLNILGSLGGLFFRGDSLWDFLRSAGLSIIILGYLSTQDARRALGH